MSSNFFYIFLCMCHGVLNGKSAATPEGNDGMSFSKLILWVLWDKQSEPIWGKCCSKFDRSNYPLDCASSSTVFSKPVSCRRSCSRLRAFCGFNDIPNQNSKCQLVTLPFGGVISKLLRLHDRMKGAIPEATHHLPHLWNRRIPTGEYAPRVLHHLPPTSYFPTNFGLISLKKL